MKLGFALPIAGEWATPDNQIRVAREAEGLGYHSLWVFQRLLYALKPRNEYPPVPGKVWPKMFECVFDPIVSLSVAACYLSYLYWDYRKWSRVVKPDGQAQGYIGGRGITSKGKNQCRLNGKLN
jgi:hypothetical protein